MERNPYFDVKNPCQRLYEAFPDMSGGHLALHAMRAMFPEINDNVAARCLRMDDERYLAFLDAKQDVLMGDPDVEILRGLVRLAGIAGSQEEVAQAVSGAKALTAAALEDFPAARKLVLRAPVYGGIYGYDVAPDLDGPLRGAFAAARRDPVAAASWMAALPSLLQMAGYDPERLDYALDVVEYMAGRAAFDAAVSGLFHARMDMARPGDESWKAAEDFLRASIEPGKDGPAPFRYVPKEPDPYQGKIHACVGFYPNGSFVVNYVRHEDLDANVGYNRTFRPGRAYFVDGEWACGGGAADGSPTDFVRKCMERIKAMELPESVTDSRPYG